MFFGLDRVHILSPFFMYAGIFCAAESIQYLTKRYKSLLVFAFLTVAHISTQWLAQFLRAFRGKISDELIIEMQNLTRGMVPINKLPKQYFEALTELKKIHVTNMVIFNGYLIFMGLIFLVIGIYLFNKYSDV